MLPRGNLLTVESVCGSKPESFGRRFGPCLQGSCDIHSSSWGEPKRPGLGGESGGLAESTTGNCCRRGIPRKSVPRDSRPRGSASGWTVGSCAGNGGSWPTRIASLPRSPVLGTGSESTSAEGRLAKAKRYLEKLREIHPNIGADLHARREFVDLAEDC